MNSVEASRYPDWGRSGIERCHAVLRNGEGILARFQSTKHAGCYRLQWVLEPGVRVPGRSSSPRQSPSSETRRVCIQTAPERGRFDVEVSATPDMATGCAGERSVPKVRPCGSGNLVTTA
jgi:hypothetical protein